MLKPVAMLMTLFVLTVRSALAAHECPEINGTFVFRERLADRILAHRITFHTKQDREVFSYAPSKNGPYQVADGKAVPVKLGNVTGTLTLTCDQGSLISETTINGVKGAYYFRHTPLSAVELEVESNIPGRDGVYRRE